jgi:hypothetical protein
MNNLKQNWEISKKPKFFLGDGIELSMIDDFNDLKKVIDEVHMQPFCKNGQQF